MKIETGIGWVREGDRLVSATPGQYVAEIERLRAALVRLEAAICGTHKFVTVAEQTEFTAALQNARELLNR